MFLIIKFLSILISGAYALSPSPKELADYKSHLNWEPEWIPKVDSWQKYMDRKVAQVSRIEDTQQKFDGYLVAVGQGKTFI